jgi:hypothetical protein
MAGVSNTTWGTGSGSGAGSRSGCCVGRRRGRIVGGSNANGRTHREGNLDGRRAFRHSEAVREGRLNAHIALRDILVLDEADGGTIRDGIPMGTSEPECRVGKLQLERVREITESVQVGGRQPDEVAVRHNDAIRSAEAAVFHRALDASLQLDRLQSRVEQARRRPLKQSFEKPLEGGEWTHGRVGSLAGTPVPAVREPGNGSDGTIGHRGAVRVFRRESWCCCVP